MLKYPQILMLKTEYKERFFYCLGIIFFLSVWWFFIPEGVLVPSLRDVIHELSLLINQGILVKDIYASIGRVIPGVAIAFAISTILSTFVAFAKNIAYSVTGVLELIRPVPPIAWVPISILFLGIGSRSAIAIVTIGAFFPIWHGMQQSIRQVHKQDILTAKSFGASNWLTFTDIIYPAILPATIHGIRMGAGLGWFCVVAAEMMGAQSGLGYGVQLYSLNLELEKTYGYILVIGVLGSIMNFALHWVETRTMHWQEPSLIDYDQR